MTIGSQNANLSIARSLMDQVLSAPAQAIEVRFFDDEEGSEALSKKRARAWAVRVYQARQAMRRAMVRMANPADLISSGLTRDAVDPEAARTAYDSLYTETYREDAPARPAWVLRIAKANLAASGLNITAL